MHDVDDTTTPYCSFSDQVCPLYVFLMCNGQTISRKRTIGSALNCLVTSDVSIFLPQIL